MISSQMPAVISCEQIVKSLQRLKLEDIKIAACKDPPGFERLRKTKLLFKILPQKQQRLVFLNKT